MFKQILFTQWRSSRLILLPLVLISFALPVVTIQALGAPGMGERFYSAAWLLDSMQIWLPLYPGLALILGTALALAGWSWDHKVGHVYALSLPLPRWEYALLKMGAGALLLLAPVTALWVGSLVGTAAVEIPDGLNAYPGALALRFLFASLLAYALLFAFAAGTARTTIAVLTGLVLFFIVGEWGVGLAANVVPSLERWSLVEWTLRQVVSWPGPADVFTGNWMLIDV